jgi:hypothetical protein
MTSAAKISECDAQTAHCMAWTFEKTQNTWLFITAIEAQLMIVTIS